MAADDLRVGELADAVFGTATIGGIDRTLVARWPTPGDPPPRSALVSSVGPLSGSTVELDTDPSAPLAAPHAPARLVGADVDHQLRYGHNRVDGLDIDIDRAVLLSTRSSTPVRVEGEHLVGGRRLRGGDRITRAGRLYTLQLDAPLDPPATSGPTHLHLRTPRHVRAHVPVPIDLPTPPTAGRLPGLPVVSALVPLLMGGALWFATRSLLAGGFMLFSTVFVVAAGFETRREARAERRFRIEEFRADLAEAAAAAAAARVDQHARLDHDAPCGEEVVRLVEEEPCRVWERVDGSLVVRVGEGPVAADDPVRPPSAGRRDLRNEARAVADAHSPFRAPVLVDLVGRGGLAVVGPDETPTALARSIIVQLCATLTPTQVHLDIAAAPGREGSWSWCCWLPHARGGPTPRSTTVRVVDGGAAGVDDDDLLVWLAPGPAGVPERIGAVVDLGDGRCGAHLDLRDDHGCWSRTRLDVTDLLDLDDALGVSRRLSGLDAGDVTQDGPGATAGLREVLEVPETLVDPRLVVDGWGRAPGGSLGAPVGWAGSAVAHLDLRAEGPHALVAGTTGSGKSELLRTLICSMSLHHPPDQLSFLLVDYKGGAAFRPLVGMPHVVGMITDLGGDLAQRALVSLRAEVRRRERLLAEHGATDLDELRATAPDDAAASLVVVVDEFATLARELPEFVDGLVDVSQRGRSLGVHLVLATQRPAGVVTDNIRANTSLRIALRVADPDESRDVVEVPDAAELPRDRPGAAVVRLGPGATTRLRFAHTGAPARAPSRIEVAPLRIGGSAFRADPTGPTQLEVAVATIAAAARGAAITPAHRPWLDPLPEHLGSGELPLDDRPGRLSVGWVDRPERQRRDVLQIDLLARGGLVITGAGGSGRTTAVKALALAGARHRCERIEVRVISSDGPLVDDSLLGDVVSVDDAERVLRLLRRLVADLDGPVGGRTLLVIDGLAAFCEVHERLRHGEAIDLLHRLGREGPRRRCHVVVTTGRRSEVPAGLAAALGATLTLRSANEDEALMAGLTAEAASPAVPAGRCWVDGELCQIAVPDDRSAPVGWSPPPAVPRLPDRVSVADLGGAPLLDADSLLPVRPDPSRHLLVAGPPGSGVTSLLGVLGELADGPTRVLRGGDVDDTTPARVRAAVGTLVVDDLPDVLGHRDHGAACADALGELLTSGDVRIIAGGEVDALLRCYDDVVTRLRSLRHGVLLGVDPGVHGALVHTDLPARPDLPNGSGRGWMVTGDGPRPVMAATLT